MQQHPEVIYNMLTDVDTDKCALAFVHICHHLELIVDTLII